MWGTAVASVGFLWGLRRALCLPAPLFLKLGTRLAHRPLQIPLPPSILPSCTWPFSQEDLPSDQCGHLGSSPRSLLPRRAPNEIWGWGWGWEARTSADRAWPQCGPVHVARLCMVAIWGPGRADLSPSSSHPSVEHGDTHENICCGAKQHPFLMTHTAPCPQSPIPGLRWGQPSITATLTGLG